MEYPDALKPKLLNSVSSGLLSVGDAVIVERETGDRGMIIASDSNSGELKVSTNAKVAPGGHPLANFAADFAVRSASGAAVTEAMRSPFPVTYRTFIVGTTGIWWRKKVVIQGAAELSDADRLRAIEDTLDEKDYYVRF
jgi:hypothetical protein